eukprot:scpid67182/ scgid2109/ 
MIICSFQQKNLLFVSDLQLGRSTSCLFSFQTCAPMENKRKKSLHHRARKQQFRGNQFQAVETEPASGENLIENASADSDERTSVSSDDSTNPWSEEEWELASAEEESSESEGDTDDTSERGNRIFSLSQLQNLLHTSAICNSGKKGKLLLTESACAGLVSTVEVTCDHCGNVTSSHAVEKATHHFDLNRMSVLGMRMLGRGREGFKKLSAFLHLPGPVTKKKFQRHSDKLHHAAKAAAQQSMKRAAYSVLTNRTASGETSPANIAVSTDGTWMRRGYSSLYGVQSVIGWDVQKVIGVEVLSRHCTRCTAKEARLTSGKLSQADFDAWKVTHTADCQANTSVSSPAMEAEAVKLLWSRSEQNNGLKYTSYIGDGDSKAYRSVCQLKPYGDMSIDKEECVGYVQKRVQSHNLRTLKQKCGSKPLSDGKPIGGKGRLTGSKIDSLQNYYGAAIRSNPGSTSGMARAIWASVCHSVSCRSSKGL